MITVVRYCYCQSYKPGIFHVTFCERQVQIQLQIQIQI